MKWFLGQNFVVVAILVPYVTNLRGTFVENLKESKINPSYCGAAPL
jgi:hypothetical protein